MVKLRLGIVLVVVLAMSLAGAVAPAQEAQAATTTVVSLTFDDGNVDQQIAPAILAAHGMQGTFYVNSGPIGTPGKFTWSQVRDLATGNEVAGHTIDHVDLTTVSTAEAQRQVCDDRLALFNHGLRPTSFAYPFGASNATLAGIVHNCGYNSGRRAWGLWSTANCPVGCPYAETIPPANVYGIRTSDNVSTDMSLSTVEGFVTQAESHGGGWVNLVFHHFCDGCDYYSLTESNFTALLDWLQPRAAQGTIVRTVQQVIGGGVVPPPGGYDTTPPTSSIVCNGAPCSTGWYSTSVQATLSATDTGGSGLDVIRYTTDGSTPTAASTPYTGPFSVSQTTTVKYRAWDNAGNVEATNSQLISFDSTAPTSSITCNGAACSSGLYAGPVSVALSASDGGGSGVAQLRYTTDGSDPTTSSASYTGPFSVSQTTTVKYRAWDNAGNVEATNSQLISFDSTAPTSSITCNGAACSSGLYAGPVSVALSASDGGGSGVAQLRYTTDGSDPTTSSASYTGPFSVSQTTTVKYRAWDNAGNVEATNSQLISFDSTAPTSSITCNGAACSSGLYAGPVSVALSASDGGGSGVAQLRYTTDGSDPTTSSASYTGPFSVSQTTTVKYRAWDNAGNVEATNSQLISFDSTAPTSSITCNGAACSSGLYAGPVSVALSASDGGGSGVAQLRYTTDGSDPTTSSASYTGPFSVSQTTTVKYRAWDNAGNVEATNSQLISFDSTAPTSSITCNGAACSSGLYAGSVSVALSASECRFGCGVIRYTTNGSDPTTSSASYTGPFSVSQTTTVKYRAWDNAGNVEATNSQLISFDSTAPTSSITCNGAACSSGLVCGAGQRRSLGRRCRLGCQRHSLHHQRLRPDHLERLVHEVLEQRSRLGLVGFEDAIELHDATSVSRMMTLNKETARCARVYAFERAPYRESRLTAVSQPYRPSALSENAHDDDAKELLAHQRGRRGATRVVRDRCDRPHARPPRSRIALVLRGKHKATYTPNVDMGDFVIVLNAGGVQLTGTKPDKKLYRHHTLFPGGIKTRSPRTCSRPTPSARSARPCGA